MGSPEPPALIAMTDLQDLGIDFGFVQPLIELWQDEKIREKLEDAGRLYYTNSFLSIDLYVYLYWGAGIIGGILLLSWLLGIDFFGLIETGGSGYGQVYRSDDVAIAELQEQVATLQEAAAGNNYRGYEGAPTQNTDAVSYGS